MSLEVEIQRNTEAIQALVKLLDVIARVPVRIAENQQVATQPAPSPAAPAASSAPAESPAAPAQITKADAPSPAAPSTAGSDVGPKGDAAPSAAATATASAPAPTTEAAASPSEAVTFEQVKQVFLRVSGKNMAALPPLLAKFGVKKASELKAEQYPAFLAELQAIESAKEAA